MVLADIIPGPPPTPQFSLIFQDIFVLIISFPLIDIIVQSLFRINIDLLTCYYLIQSATLLRVHEWSQTVIVQTVILHEIDNVEFVRPVFPSVTDTKIEPLCIASGVVIGFEYEVILVFVDLDNSAEVTRLKSTFEC